MLNLFEKATYFFSEFFPRIWILYFLELAYDKSYSNLAEIFHFEAIQNIDKSNRMLEQMSVIVFLVAEK